MKQWFVDHPYYVAVFLVIIALLLQMGAMNLLGPLSPFLFFFAAVSVATWLGGLGPGVAATALSAAAIDYSLMPPIGTLSGKTMSELVPLLIFIGSGLLITWLFHLVQDTNRRLTHSLDTTEAALERAEESNTLKRNFIANMSHEIRAPLSAVLGYSDLLAGGDLSNSERSTYLERLKLNAASLTHLVTDLLDVTEIDSAYFVANRKWIALPSFVQEAYAAFEPMAQEKGLKFQIQLRGSIPTYVETDPDQLMQILRQVVGNAIRYSDEGLVKLTVSASKTSTGRREVGFIVNDQGGGIASDVRNKLFKPFPKGAEPRSKNHSGTGLGLTVARKLARGLGGDVKVAKSDRKGTTVLITLDGGPVNEVNEFFERLADTPKTELSADDPHALEGTRVLVVDDSSDSALLVRRMLETVGARVDTANRGLEGVDKALRDTPDLVLMDIQMPEVDGNEATRRLRASGFKRPIIALSAHVMKEDKEEASRSGINEYLMKPVSRRALLEVIGRYTRRRRPRPEEYGELTPQPIH